MAVGSGAGGFQSATQRRVLHGVNLGITLGVAGVLLVLINMAAARWLDPAKTAANPLDWTQASLNSLDPATLDILVNIGEGVEVEMIGILDPDSGRSPITGFSERLRRILDLYERESDGRITVRVIHPTVDTEAFEALRRDPLLGRLIEGNAVIVYRKTSGGHPEKPRSVPGREMVVRRPPPAPPRFAGEQAISAVLLDVISDRKPRVLLSTGHGEIEAAPGDPRSIAELGRILDREHIELFPESLGRAEEEGIDYDAILIAGPRRAFQPDEVDVLIRHLEKGRGVVLLLDPVPNDAQSALQPTGVETFLRERGVHLGEGVLIHRRQNGGSPGYLILDRIAEHEVTRTINLDPESLGGGILIRQPTSWFHFRGVRAVERSTDPVEEWNVAELLRTYPGTEDRVAIASDRFVPGTDREGEFAVAVAVSRSLFAEGDDASRQGRMIVVGNSEFVTDSLVGQVPPHRELIVSSIRWVLGQKSRFTLPDRDDVVTFSAEPRRVKRIFWGCLLGIPGFSFLLGITVWTFRRR